MKTLLTLFTLASVLCVAPAIVNAEEGHEHEHEQVGGPKGGRLLDNTDPRAEFFVEKDRSITVAFYDDNLKPVPVADQSVLVIADTKEGKSQIEFEKKGDVLVSKERLPQAESVNLVVQIKQSSDAKPQNFRFTYEDKVCEMCKHAEYACICGH